MRASLLCYRAAVISSQRPKPPPPALRNAVRPHRVTCHHRARDHSFRHIPVPIGRLLEPSLYLQPFSRYSAPTHVNEHTNTLKNERRHTHQQTRRIAIAPGSEVMNNFNILTLTHSAEYLQ